MKKNTIESIVLEFVHKINEDKLYYLLDFVFKSKPAGYLADLCDFMSDESVMDHWLKSAPSGDKFFDRIDMIESAVYQEVELREQTQKNKKK